MAVPELHRESNTLSLAPLPGSGLAVVLTLLLKETGPAFSTTLAGPEIGGGNFLSDTSPEAKAAELRAVPSVHYLESEQSQ